MCVAVAAESVVPLPSRTRISASVVGSLRAVHPVVNAYEPHLSTRTSHLDIGRPVEGGAANHRLLLCWYNRSLCDRSIDRFERVNAHCSPKRNRSSDHCGMTVGLPAWSRDSRAARRLSCASSLARSAAFSSCKAFTSASFSFLICCVAETLSMAMAS